MTPDATHKASDSLDALGSELLGTLFAALRTLGVHKANNAAVSGTAQRLLALLGEVVASEGNLQLIFLEDDVYLNGARIRVVRQELPRYVSLVRELKQNGVVRIDSTGAPTLNDVLRLLEAIARPSEGTNRVSFGALSLEFARDRSARLPEYLIDRRQYALRVYAKAVLFLQDSVQMLQAGQTPPIRKAYRLVQDLVDIASADVVPLLGLAAIRENSDFIFHHSLNVTVLAIVMGQRLKMSRQALAELGMAGLLHDLGKVSVPREILYKTTALTEPERKALDQIPRETLRILLKHSVISHGHPAQIILAYETHLVRSVKEYVRIYGQRSLYYQTQILCIANFYDALTSARAQRGPYLPDQALQLLAAQAGERFDPVLVRVFTNVIGIYPLGTLVVLNDGTMGVVVHTAAEEPRRPLVKLVLDVGGNRFDGPYVDLASDGETRQVVGSVNPYEYKINVLKYVMG